jgi:hypothetical protein
MLKKIFQIDLLDYSEFYIGETAEEVLEFYTKTTGVTKEELYDSSSDDALPIELSDEEVNRMTLIIDINDEKGDFIKTEKKTFRQVFDEVMANTNAKFPYHLASTEYID